MTNLRKYATPLTIGSFAVMAVTGILMFFHLDSGLNKLAHEWLSWAMVAAVALHVVLNWRAFSLYFKRPLAMGLIGVFVAVLGLSFLPLRGEQKGGRPDFAAVELVVTAPISKLAPLLDADTGTLLARLQAAGIAASAEQSLSDLAAGDTRQAARMIATIKGDRQR